jgi:ABC-type Zn uptake system ZnuABC Zn-binding protein ZnuA
MRNRLERLGLGAVGAIAVLLLTLTVVLTAGCGEGSADSTAGPSTGPGEGTEGGLKVMAVESFISDIAGNVLGETAEIEPLIPAGVDPHSFQMTPADATKLAECDVLVMNGADLVPGLEDAVETIGGDVLVIEASAGLVGRSAGEGEGEGEEAEDHHHGETDPHFWLDPVSVIHYVENIRDGLSEADPANAAAYEANATAYIDSLRDLDEWIRQQVAGIPADRRLLVTNHESFGYYADRYGFEVLGTVIGSVSTGASPSAQHIVELVELIRTTEVRAIFLEQGSDPQLAQQLAAETGVEVVTDLYTHSLTDADGLAPTYVDMMKANTTTIVEALK